MNDSLVRRLALACSRGERQTSILNELLTGREVPIQNRGYRPDQQWWTVGYTNIPFASFAALRKRLVAVGFVFQYNKTRTAVKMHFPEAE